LFLRNFFSGNKGVPCEQTDFFVTRPESVGEEDGNVISRVPDEKLGDESLPFHRHKILHFRDQFFTGANVAPKAPDVCLDDTERCFYKPLFSGSSVPEVPGMVD